MNIVVLVTELMKRNFDARIQFPSQIMLRIALLSVCKHSGAKVTPVLECVSCWSLIVTGPDLFSALRGPKHAVLL